MIELQFSKPSQIGEVKVHLRIIGKIIYFKFNDTNESNQIIKVMESKGAKIVKGNGWIQVNIFYSYPSDALIKLGDKEIDLGKDNDEMIEKKLGEFYLVQYVKNGFKVI